jgi:hypothetical protein
MKRSSFKRPHPKPAKQIDYTPRPRAVAVATSVARMSVPVPKFAYVRDLRFRAMCQAMECQLCGSHSGVTWAHSNQAIHGKGRGIKASDQFVAALCHSCHHEIDQGHCWSREFKVSAWNRAHAQTVREAMKRGLWPTGFPTDGGA